LTAKSIYSIVIGEKILARISKIYRIIISALLALLGFSCGKFINNGYAEYGTPSANYKAKGVVVSEVDDSPIKGIQAELKRQDAYDTRDIDTAHTNSEGSFSLEGEEFPRQKLYVILTDVDGEENGLYAPMEVEADYTNATFTGGSGNWYEGKAEIDLGIIKMKPEEPEEPENPE
jgi:putative lipoprotein (rSAM/lipoprotein system)